MMDNQELSRFFDNVTILCATCGEPMRFMGEWPVQYPTTGITHTNFQQALRWLCKTCRKPHEDAKCGICIGFSMVLEPTLQKIKVD